MKRNTADKGRVLIVDDDPMTLFLIADFLEGRYEVKTATSGEEALELVHGFMPDIMLLDVMMPGMDGYEVCRAIRADSSLAGIKVIFVSAKELLKDRLQGYEAGGEDFVTKPFKQEELLAKVKVFLRIKRREDAGNAKRQEKGEDTNVFEKIVEYFNRIIYIKARFPVCEVHADSKDDDAFIIRTTLKKLEEDFNEDFLLRVHRSYLVNPRKIVGMNRKGVQDYQLHLVDSGDDVVFVPIGRKYQRMLEGKYPKNLLF